MVAARDAYVPAMLRPRRGMPVSPRVPVCSGLLAAHDTRWGGAITDRDRVVQPRAEVCRAAMP